ncbi:MAG: translation elongation factor Ts [Candidatus Omnitrophota bacterium]
MALNVDVIKQIREKTGAGVMDCKHALKDADGNIDKAIEILNRKGIAIAQKKSSRVAKEGVISSYIHHSNKIGVLLEVNCETDFVARNDEFGAFVKDITMQVAATDPKFITTEEVNPDMVKGLNDQEKQEFFTQHCLLEQPFIKDQALIIKNYLTQLIAKIGENIVIRRFIRYQVGGE